MLFFDWYNSIYIICIFLYFIININFFYLHKQFYSELKSESKKKERRKDDKLKGDNTSTTDEELMDSQRE